MPELVAHADWSVNPNKRWLALGKLGEDGRYYTQPPEQVVNPRVILKSLHTRKPPIGALLVGFDFPIGLPGQYAKIHGIDSFLAVLPKFGKGIWLQFFNVADHPEDISEYRPFYPKRPGGAKQKFLTAALGVESMDALRRTCERKYPGRRPAAPLFWTIGPQQVGKMAILGWREVLIPGLSAFENTLRFWPFSGRLSKLLSSNKIIVVESYPAEYYRHLGIMNSSMGDVRFSKRDWVSRKQVGKVLLQWAIKANVVLDQTTKDLITGGFDVGGVGEDMFDAVVGLMGMLNVILGFKPHEEPVMTGLNRIEGWIFGLSLDPK